ncbi:hypothetical protein EDB19DRAFT_2025903 [Suillus lakei]|nr:hypothetical protein EDB19DRAFT_2025903 [Suillus lakei]
MRDQQRCELPDKARPSGTNVKRWAGNGCRSQRSLLSTEPEEEVELMLHAVCRPDARPEEAGAMTRENAGGDDGSEGVKCLFGVHMYLPSMQQLGMRSGQYSDLKNIGDTGRRSVMFDTKNAGDVVPKEQITTNTVSYRLTRLQLLYNTERLRDTPSIHTPPPVVETPLSNAMHPTHSHFLPGSAPTPNWDAVRHPSREGHNPLQGYKKDAV